MTLGVMVRPVVNNRICWLQLPVQPRNVLEVAELALRKTILAEGYRHGRIAGRRGRCMCAE
jgi:hypothetical protein